MAWTKTANLKGPMGADGAGGTGTVSAVTIDTTQTVTGAKDFTGGLTASGVAVVVTTDIRLTDQRIPTDGSVTTAKIASGGLAPTVITGTAVITTDTRLGDARTPTAHAATHGLGGTDAVTVAESQVTGLVTDLAAKVDLTSAQTISGAKTFSAATVINGSATFQANTGFAINQNATNASNNFAGVMALNNNVTVGSSAPATSTTIAQNSRTLTLNGAYWSGTASSNAGVTLIYTPSSQLGGRLNVNQQLGAVGLYDNGNPVYSLGNKVPVAGISTSAGTAGANTFLRGDGAWASNVLWNDNTIGNQTATSAITFSGGIAFSLASGYAINQTGVSATSNFLGQATFQNNVWVSGSNSQLILDRVAAASAGTVAQPSVNLTFNGSYYSGGATAVSASLNFIPTSTSTGRLSTAVALMASGGLYDGGNRVYSGANLVPVAGLSATGTKDATTFLRGDGTWALPPAAPVTSVAGRTGAVVLGPTDITGTAVITTDTRLSDTRTPTDLSVTTAKIASAGLAPTAITGTAVITTDTRLTNARTPTTHAATHALGGADALTLDESQVTNLVTDLAAKYSPTNTPPGASVGRPYLARTISADQSVGLNADVQVLFDSLAEDYAVGSGATAIITYSAGVFTAVRTGLYVISGTVRFSAAANGERYMAVGSSVQATYAANRWASSGQPGSVACPSTLSCTAMRYLTAGTTFSVWCFQSSGAALTIQAGFASTRVEITYLG